ncbi:hypothetical protein VTJ04DRAFT_9635 [Mycothermus thermophilus]|uniref:uncharacterized protein n=1 Tax=Humicola insolens TaxID=85995 RepID=UPI003744183F
MYSVLLQLASPTCPTFSPSGPSEPCHFDAPGVDSSTLTRNCRSACGPVPRHRGSPAPRSRRLVAERRELLGGGTGGFATAIPWGLETSLTHFVSGCATPCAVSRPVRFPLPELSIRSASLYFALLSLCFRLRHSVGSVSVAPVHPSGVRHPRRAYRPASFCFNRGPIFFPDRAQPEPPSHHHQPTHTIHDTVSTPTHSVRRYQRCSKEGLRRVLTTPRTIPFGCLFWSKIHRVAKRAQPIAASPSATSFARARHFHRDTRPLLKLDIIALAPRIAGTPPQP